MRKALLARLVDHCGSLLRIGDIQDYPGAVNGLQVENSGEITRIAAAVDASLATARKAIAQKADLLIVHHGLFWSARHPWVGRNYELMRLLLDNNLAIYSAHLPLDMHAQLGNNARLCASLGLRSLRPFFQSKGQAIGLQSNTSLRRAMLKQRLEGAVEGKVILIPGGPEVCRRIGVVTGGAGAELKQAAEEGVDTFITGEGPHWTYALAEELGVNVLYGGHYATETFGVKALSAHLSKKYRLPWTFVDHPTGL